MFNNGHGDMLTPCTGACPNRRTARIRPSDGPTKVVVIKLGGALCSSAAPLARLAQDLRELHSRGIRVVIVHGGGAEISAALSAQKIDNAFHRGRRVTCHKTLDVVKTVLRGTVNLRIVMELRRHGVNAAGLSGVDGGCVECVPSDPDLGYVGQPIVLKNALLDQIWGGAAIPVLAPLAADEKGEVYNVNADTFAGFLAEELRAEVLLLMTNVAGVLDKEGLLLDTLTEREFSDFQNTGVIGGGMVPKVQTALSALQRGVSKSFILDGRNSKSCLRAIEGFSGGGTKVLTV